MSSSGRRGSADPVRGAEVAAACRTWAGQLTWRAERRRAGPAGQPASAARGTSLAARPGAWIVAQATTW